MRQGLDLADCAAATRIRERYLIAIEDGRFESLPGPAYVSGFVRAYAAHLGVAVDGPVRELPVPGQPTMQGRMQPVTLTATRITPRGVGQRPRWRRPRPRSNPHPMARATWSRPRTAARSRSGRPCSTVRSRARV